MVGCQFGRSNAADMSTRVSPIDGDPVNRDRVSQWLIVDPNIPMPLILATVNKMLNVFYDTNCSYVTQTAYRTLHLWLTTLLYTIAIVDSNEETRNISIYHPNRIRTGIASLHKHFDLGGLKGRILCYKNRWR